jgi:hypothetical protein
LHFSGIDIEFRWSIEMKSTKLLGTAWAVLMVVVCVSGMASAEETKPARGAELLAPMKTALKQALMAGMQKGPVNAISVCKDRAPEIADSLSVDGSQIGRTSHRLRNPANSAPAWVDPVLKAYLNEGSDREPRHLNLPDDRQGYVEPIVLQPLCLACHGESLAPDVVAQIEEAYPEDEATGFEVGDLRGVYWVEYAEEPGK